MVVELDVTSRDRSMMRLDRVRQISHDFGYGVGDDMDYRVAEHTKDVHKAVRYACPAGIQSRSRSSGAMPRINGSAKRICVCGVF